VADFRGEIEFQNVWFRYPTRKQQWVFKGLNLKIARQEAIAIVGESGQGKSTFINLVMRFYDPEFGRVLIDGVDVREYHVEDLRRRMGLVMQEPTLFNYSVKENILYGDSKATNEALTEAVAISNAKEFIESDTLKYQFADEPSSLLEHWTSDEYKGVLSSEMGEEKYKKQLEVLKKLSEKAKAEGKWEEVQNLID